MKEKEYRKIIDKIYNLIATNTNFKNRTTIDKQIIDLINIIYLKER